MSVAVIRIRLESRQAEKIHLEMIVRDISDGPRLSNKKIQ